MGLTKPRAAQIFNLDYKQATRVVTVANITLTGGAPAVVDGVTLAEDDRVLVTAQSTGTQNGLYIVSAVGAGSNGTWVRTSDGNETGEIEAGMIVMVTEGTVYADTQWKLITDNPIVIGTTALTFTQNYSANSISGGTSNVAVYSNANVTISSAGTANVLTVSSTGVVVTGTVSATGNVTGGNLLTVGFLSASGNVTGNYILGNGSQLTGITGGGGSSDANALTGNTLSSNVVNSSLTSVGTLGSLSVTGNITSGNISATNHTGTTVSVTGAVTGAGITGSSLTVSTGNITAGNLILSGAIVDSAQLDIQTSAGNANIVLTPNGTGNVNTGANLSVTGNVVAGNVSGTNITGTLATASQTNITSVGTLTSVSVSGNTTSGNILTGGLISATGNITGGNLIQGSSRVIKWTTVANTAPTGAVPGDFWYNSYSNIKYQYTNDGTSNVWIDQSSPTSFSTITVGNIVNSNGNGVGNIGASGGYFNTVFAKATSAQYADLAEMYVSDQSYPAGTVVDFGGNYEITLSTHTHSTRIAGVISTHPSYLMNSTQQGEHVLPVALTGRVPCQVVGTMYKGDRLVASSISGVATTLDKDLYEPGCIIGKALEDYNSNTVGIIEIAVGRY